MARLEIRLLGQFQVTLDGKEVTTFESNKVRALCALLAAEAKRSHPRDRLAGLLWPDWPQKSAMSNLRYALSDLRKNIGDRQADPPFLLISREAIRLNPEGDARVDVGEFELKAISAQPSVISDLQSAIELYWGEFLEGFSLSDSPAYEEWILAKREYYQRHALQALYALAESHEQRGEYELALSYARKQLELEPWQEGAHQQVMQLLVLSGQRIAALVQYETCQRLLAKELGAKPSAETTRLIEKIRNGQLEIPTLAPAQEPEALLRLPGFLMQETDAVDPPVFVARERELACLNAHLDEALAGQGHAIFVTGDPGRGKTALLTEFGRRAMEVDPDLLVASGNCNAYSGVGDPYLPFREVMAMLTGDVETRWLAGAISTTQARHLWNAFPGVIQSLLHHGPHVTGPLISGQALLSRAAIWCATPDAGRQSTVWLHRLRRRIEHQRGDPEGTEQSFLFEQVTNLLRNLAQTHPLLLILDDLQWADTASISLLFHLGRRLGGSRILIAGAYRAEEVALGRPATPDREQYFTSSEQVAQHPLQKVVSEFKRNHGDILLDLTEIGESEQRRFVDALLETEPNHLGEGFRKQLTRRAGGHPLFAVELVRAMQARGDLVLDSKGRWTEGSVLDWETLPVRVEGAIEVRVGRLEPELREILSVACVEGETFTLGVMAQVVGIEEGVLLRRLAQDLARRHGLVVEQADLQIGPRQLNRFKFGHALVQNYLYQQLSQGERWLLHGQVATALESCYGERVDEFSVQLAHHHSRAGDDGRALHYFTQAAENAQRVYANEEACAHYTRAIEAAKRVSADAESVIRLYLGRGRTCQTLDDFEGALANYEAALQLVSNTGEHAFENLKWRAHIDLGRLWTSRDYNCAYDFFQEALKLVHRRGDPKVFAESLNWVGNWYLNQANLLAAIEHHERALEIFEQAKDQRGLAVTLDLLGITSLLAGDMTACVGYYDRAIALFREMDDLPNLASSLTGRGHAGCSTYTLLTSVPPAIPIHPRRDFEEAARITRKIGSPAGEAWVHWSLGVLETVQGRYGQALEVIQRGIDIATQIRHSEWIVGNRSTLGALYIELLMPEQARQQLEPALILAEELGSWVWLYGITGTLAAAYCLVDDSRRAQTLLESVLSSDTPMDTMNKRYCWARRAELALCQGDPALALDIVERLIASAPGMAPGRVISFLWKVKGEALTALGDMETACSMLRAAIENARLTGERFLLWHLHASLGRLYQVMGRRSEAENELSNARELIRELADSITDVELRDNFLRRAHARLRASA